MDTTPGQSGAPIIAWDPRRTDMGEMICVGIHNYGKSGHNQATRITTAVIEQVRQFLGT